MFQNRLVNIMMIILVSITLLGVILFVLVNYYSTDEVGAEPTIEEIIENSWETEEITTNLEDNHFAKTRFRIHVDSKDGRKEIEKRDFQVNNIIIHELAGMSSADLESQEGMEQLEKRLRSKVTSVLQNGEVIRVYTTERMIQ